MKKIYAVYGTVELTEKPGWLDSFKEKYDRPHPLHITLKQMAYIDDSELPKIKEILEPILDSANLSRQKLQLVFDTFVVSDNDDDDGKGWMFINATKRNAVLDTLQKEIRTSLSQYSDYYFKDSRTYEYDFKPHITIATALDQDTYAEALKQLHDQVYCRGEITNITLSCVTEPTLEEANNPKNLTAYVLDKIATE